MSNDHASFVSSRRKFLMTTASSAAGPVLARAFTGEARAQSVARNPREPVNVRLEVNGHVHDLSLDVRTTLLDALREHLGLTGSKKAAIRASAALAPSWLMVAAYLAA
jgi:xanthine dehydrogenase YagT iron-sulfur-binding subunit